MRTSIYLLPLLLLSTLLQHSYAQTLYRRNSVASGFTINDCTTLDDSTIITVGNDGVILRTQTLFHTWNKADSSIRQHLHAITGLDNNTCVAVGDDGTIMRSSDGGFHWERITTTINDTLTDITHNEQGTLFCIGLNGLVMHSIDGGKTWEYNRYEKIGHCKKINFRNGIGIIVGTGNIILKTEDGGKTWVSVQHPYSVPLYSVTWVDNTKIIVGGDSLSIGYSTDNGNTWSSQQRIIDVPIPNESILITSLVIKDIVFTDEQNGYAVGVLFFSDVGKTYNSIIETHDGGTTWSIKDIRITLPSLNSTLPLYTGLHLIPNTKKVLSLGAHSLKGNPYIAMNVNNTTWQTLFLGNGFKEFITFGNDTTEYEPDFSQVHFFNSRKAVALQGGYFLYLRKSLGEQIGKIVISNDNGRTWQNSLFLIDTLRINKMFPLDTNDLIASISDKVTPVGFMRSYNFGKTWFWDTTIVKGIYAVVNDTTYIEDLFSTKDSYYWATVTKPEKSGKYTQLLLQSTDRGATWNIVPLTNKNSEEILNLKAKFTTSDKGIIYMRVYDSVEKKYSKRISLTNNGGVEWIPFNFSETQSFHSYVFDRNVNHIWIGEFIASEIDNTIPSWTKIYHSADNGSTWDTLDFEKTLLKPRLKNTYCVLMDFIDENNGIMITEVERFRSILLTSNGGKSWSVLPFTSNNGFLSYQYYDKNILYLGCKENALYYFDPQTFTTDIEDSDIENTTVPAIHIWNVYPNPAEKGKIHLQLTWLENVQPHDMNFRLYTVGGIEQTHSLTVENWVKGAGYGIVTLNTQSVPNGLYILSCESGTYKTAKIIIVNR